MDRTTLFVNEFCNQLAKMDHNLQKMVSWYLFSDNRPGTIAEKFKADADEYSEYVKMFQV